MDEVGTGELQQQQQLINNLGQIEVSQDKRIQDLEKQNSLIRARESKISQDSKKNLQRAFGAEGRIKDLNSQIRSVKYQINSHNSRESKISQDSKKNLQRAFGAEGRIKDLNSQIRSLKYQINSHNCNYVLNKINYKK
ncbi:hypothetical protein GLOIN_2v1787226 [Rhizophagus irregularis DAOM 181602=DAOM 197198]|uniref:Uncharacterized protein n=1 Tax=Rhizophagus irregularis (strain DAOM 181602 / DAOM 197198 / MUCL 43194) TaxID=747089 RepID=A0A2P4P6C9_RHIID|nr:hypothetical protein GLOIN_2v1787226 [Rhizophagus irregularis DAOM 181602=DAOM 197198]POG60942.1 hypothetical protein GLOIN_2v1787226 [Rhizophagus irregularis DAOM 181602=DAOM 197198]|eukprot:XP_025167808.1 hypothetical protein GLOIN_2v1787226 [Rhizophagus irregularis DAOM 181602=DAOM 197198]